MNSNEAFRKTVGDLVDELVKMENRDKEEIGEDNDIVVQLRKINEEILNHKIIADQYTIYPIWVEAYYNNSNKNFIDNSCHDKTNVLGQFMFRKHNKGRGGVDLYLGKPNEDYYLSFLIKMALIKEGNGDSELRPQIRIKDCLNKYIDKDLEFIKYDLDTNHFEIVEGKRAGLKRGSEGCKNYCDLQLASYIEEVGKKRIYATLRKKEQLYKELTNSAQV